MMNLKMTTFNKLFLFFLISANVNSATVKDMNKRIKNKGYRYRNFSNWKKDKRYRSWNWKNGRRKKRNRRGNYCS